MFPWVGEFVLEKMPMGCFSCCLEYGCVPASAMAFYVYICQKDDNQFHDIWWWYSGWAPLFGQTFCRKNDQTALVWPFEACKPQQVPKEVSTYFSLNLARSETLMLPKIAPGHFPKIVMLTMTRLG